MIFDLLGAFIRTILMVLHTCDASIHLGMPVQAYDPVGTEVLQTWRDRPWNVTTKV